MREENNGTLESDENDDASSVDRVISLNNNIALIHGQTTEKRSTTIVVKECTILTRKMTMLTILIMKICLMVVPKDSNF